MIEKIIGNIDFDPIGVAYLVNFKDENFVIRYDPISATYSIISKEKELKDD